MHAEVTHKVNNRGRYFSNKGGDDVNGGNTKKENGLAFKRRTVLLLIKGPGS